MPCCSTAFEIPICWAKALVKSGDVDVHASAAKIDVRKTWVQPSQLHKKALELFPLIIATEATCKAHTAAGLLHKQERC